MLCFSLIKRGALEGSLVLLPDFVRTKFPDINRIVLAVHVENTAAQSLYKKCGFFMREYVYPVYLFLPKLTNFEFNLIINSTFAQ